MELIGNGLEHVLQKFPGGSPVSSFNELGHGEFGCPVDTHEKVKPIVGKTVPPDCSLMGGRGTDVAREAASIVLLDDDFGSIVTTIRLGRRIYDNIRKAMSFIFAVHVPIAGLALMPLVFGLPLLFGPMHIAFLEMVIDPVCSLVFEAETEEDGVMRRKPRCKDEPLFAISTIVWSILQGGLAFAAVTTIFVLSLQYGLAEDQARALTFVSLIAAIVALIFVNR